MLLWLLCSMNSKYLQYGFLDHAVQACPFSSVLMMATTWLMQETKVCQECVLPRHGACQRLQQFCCCLGWSHQCMFAFYGVKRNGSCCLIRAVLHHFHGEHSDNLHLKVKILLLSKAKKGHMKLSSANIFESCAWPNSALY